MIPFVFHAITTYLVMLLSRCLGAQPKASLFAALLFMFSTSFKTTLFWTSCIGDILSVMVSLGSILVLYGKRNNTYLASFLFFMALFFKESVVGIPFILMALHFARPLLTSILLPRKIPYISYFVAFTAYLFIRNFVLGAILPSGSWTSQFLFVGFNTIKSIAEYALVLFSAVPVQYVITYPLLVPTLIAIPLLLWNYAKSSTVKKTIGKTAFIFLILLFTILPVINHFSQWYLYFATVILYSILALSFSNTTIRSWQCRLATVILAFSAVFHFVVAKNFENAGIFTKTILAQTAQLPEDTVSFCNFPYDAFLGCGIFPTGGYMELGLDVMHNSKKTIKFIGNTTLQSIPGSYTLDKQTVSHFSDSLPFWGAAYFQNRLLIDSITDWEIETSGRTILGKPSKLVAQRSQPADVYFLKWN